MTENIDFILYGTPTAKGRARATKTGRQYTPAKTRMAEQSILAAYLHVAGNRQPHDGPVRVHIVATFLPPTSWPKWKRDEALAGRWPHLTKPDNDNLQKIIDGLNGVAWVDDSQITDQSGSKTYGPIAQTLVRIWFYPSPAKPTK